MSFTDVIRSGIATADKLTKPLQPFVTLKAWIGQDGKGKDAYAAPVQLRAIVDRTQKVVYGPNNVGTIVQATVLFVGPVAPTTPNAGQERINPVDPRDIIVLDDGFTAPIVKAGGFEDAGKTRPFYTEVLLGTAVRA